MSRNDGGPAFPSVGPDGSGYDGLSLRDWFAGQALTAILAGRTTVGCGLWPTFARDAYEMADAMLAARTKERSS